MAKKSSTNKGRKALEKDQALLVTFEKTYLLKVVQSDFKQKEIIKITRVFDPREKIEGLLKGEDISQFDVDKVLSKSYASKPKDEQDLLRVFRFSFSDSTTKEKFAKMFSEHKDVVNVENDEIAEAYGTPVPVPNDDKYKLLWGMEKIKARDVWDCSKGCGVVVAVIDTGVDYKHPDLNHNMWEPTPGKMGLNFTNDNGGNPFDPMDGHGHGTHVSGTIAAEGNNQYGVIGVAPQAKIMALKALYNSKYGHVSDLANALVSAALLGADVINNSWGFVDRVPSNYTLSVAVTFAFNQGSIVVFGAGNANDNTVHYYPQNDKRTITVASTDGLDKKAASSNFGDEVDVSAPGVKIYSTLPGSNFGYDSGTSMAAPHVSGMIALILSKHPNLDFETVKNVVQTYSIPFPNDVTLGAGRISLEHLEELLCSCGSSACGIQTILGKRVLEYKRLSKFNVVPSSGSKGCTNVVPQKCYPVKIPNIKPCFELYWGDSKEDQIETRDTEVVYIRVCNPYNNVAFKGLKITSITISPVHILPNHDPSIRIIPSEIICYDNVLPCSCSTREFALLTRSAVPGQYKVHFEYCMDEVALLGKKHGKDEFSIRLINS